MKNVIFLLLSVILLCSCSIDKQDIQVENLPENSLNEVESSNADDSDTISNDTEDITQNEKIYYGEWEVENLFFSDAPSIWGKDELEKYIGCKVDLASEKVIFDGNELMNPTYGERVLTSEELVQEFVTTYDAIGITSEELPLFVTIYKDSKMSEDETWISDSVIYRFFVKDENTLIAENRNVYFVLTRIQD